YPDEPFLLLARVGCLRSLGRRDERLAQLKRLSHPGYTAPVTQGASSTPGADPAFAQQYAQELAADAREHRTSERLLRRVLRLRPFTPSAYGVLANLFWDANRRDPALAPDRFGTFLDDMDAGLARAYFRAARSLDRTDAALHLLQDRFERFGKRTSQPARALFHALADLDRSREGFTVLDQALQERPGDSELLLFAAEMRAAFGD